MKSLLREHWLSIFTQPFFWSMLLFTLLFPQHGHTQASSTVYQKFQQISPESLVIKIETVRSSITSQVAKFDKIYSVEEQIQIKARVIEPIHSASHLKRGDIIQIHYRHTKYVNIVIMCSSEVPSLHRGETVRAYLIPDKVLAIYKPAARRESFVRIYQPGIGVLSKYRRKHGIQAFKLSWESTNNDFTTSHPIEFDYDINRLRFFPSINILPPGKYRVQIHKWLLEQDRIQLQKNEPVFIAEPIDDRQ